MAAALVVIGAGLLGVEVAASFVRVGLAVDLIVGDAFPWPRFAGEGTGRCLAMFLEHHGVKVHLGAVRWKATDAFSALCSATGRRSIATFALAAVGTIVNKGFLRNTSIAAENAILVDDRCRTNAPNVFSAGDCAAVFDPLFGKHRIVDHWENAVITGTIAGRNMAGADEAYRSVTSFTSEIFGLKLRGWGEARQVDHRLLRAPPRPRRLALSSWKLALPLMAASPRCSPSVMALRKMRFANWSPADFKSRGMRRHSRTLTRRWANFWCSMGPESPVRLCT